MENIGSRSISAVFWGAAGALLRLVLQFGSQVFFARMLGPDQYGLFALGAIVVGFSNFFSDIGLAYGLIQKREVNALDIRFVFTWQVILGLAVSTVLAWKASGVAMFFGDERATEFVRVLSVICFFNAIAAPSINLLKRNLEFKQIQLCQVVSFIIGYLLVGVPLAITGYQAWSLVFSWIMQALVLAILAYFSVRHPLTPLAWFPGARAISGYGSMVFLTNILNWIITNIDRVIVGRVFTVREIGLYATTYNMLYTPTTTFIGVVQPVFFSASSRASGDGSFVEKTYRMLVVALVVFVLPIFLCLGLVSETFVLAIYGEKWRAATDLFRPLAFAMPFFILWGLTTPLLWSGGHGSREFKSQLLLAVIWLAACGVAAQYGLKNIAWTVLILFVLRSLALVWVAARHVGLDLARLWRSVRRAIVSSMLLAALVCSVDAQLTYFSYHMRLLSDFLLAGIGLISIIRYFPSVIDPDLVELLKRVAAALPKFIVDSIKSICVRS